MGWKENKKSAQDWIRDTRFHIFGTVLGAPRRKKPAVYRYIPPPKSTCCVKERRNYRREARARGLLVRRPNETNLKAILADLNPEVTVAESDASNGELARFTRFLDLPKQLREQIYVLHIMSLEQTRLESLDNANLAQPPHDDTLDDHCYKPAPPHEPPITRVSRLVREESRPLFYSNHRFPIIAHLEYGYRYSIVDWYRHLEPSCVSCIRRLELYVCFEQRDRKLMGTDNPTFLADAFVLHVDLDRKGNTYTSERKDQITPNAAFGNRLVNLENLEQDIHDRLAAAVNDMSVGHFTSKELYSLIPPEQVQ